jgi:hypothetical protein
LGIGVAGGSGYLTLPEIVAMPLLPNGAQSPFSLSASINVEYGGSFVVNPLFASDEGADEVFIINNTLLQAPILSLIVAPTI